MNEVVARLEYVAATYTVAEGVDASGYNETKGDEKGGWRSMWQPDERDMSWREKPTFTTDDKHAY